MADPRSQVLVILDGAPPDVVGYVADGLEGTRTLPVHSATALRQGHAGLVGVVDVEPAEGARLLIGDDEIPIQADDLLVELAVVESGWHVGSVASDPLTLVPTDVGVLQLPVVGWLTWLFLAAGIAWLAEGSR